MPFPKRFSYKDVEHMRKLHESGLSYRAIARMVKADQRTVRRACQGDSHIDETTPTTYLDRLSKPQQMLRDAAEREWHKRRHTIPTPKTLNQKLLGDPLPGRSALDRRRVDEEKQGREKVGVPLPSRRCRVMS